jgi:hypothetical protein
LHALCSNISAQEALLQAAEIYGGLLRGYRDKGRRDGQLKGFVGVVSSVEDMGENALDGRQWRVSIEVADWRIRPL